MKVFTESQLKNYIGKRTRQLIRESESEKANTKQNQSRSNKIKSSKEDMKLWGAKDGIGDSAENADFFLKYAGGKEDVKIDGAWSEDGKSKRFEDGVAKKAVKGDFIKGNKPKGKFSS